MEAASLYHAFDFCVPDQPLPELSDQQQTSCMDAATLAELVAHETAESAQIQPSCCIMVCQAASRGASHARAAVLSRSPQRADSHALCIRKPCGNAHHKIDPQPWTRSPASNTQRLRQLCGGPDPGVSSQQRQAPAPVTAGA